jgi:hypothetical protein
LTFFLVEKLDEEITGFPAIFRFLGPKVALSFHKWYPINSYLKIPLKPDSGKIPKG